MGDQGALILTPISTTGIANSQHLCGTGHGSITHVVMVHSWHSHGAYVVDFALNHCTSRVQGAAAILYHPCTTFTSVYPTRL